MSDDRLYESIGNYTKFKLVEMMINKHKDTIKGLNHIEDVCDDVLNVISLCGLKYHQELRGEFGGDIQKKQNKRKT